MLYYDIKPAAYKQILKSGTFNNIYYELYVEGPNLIASSKCPCREGIPYEYIIA